jgi:diguanylate cyclase (GGDEF)-like protein
VSFGTDPAELSHAALASLTDLTGCDAEPIAYSGAIQPHGFLLGVDPETLRVRVVSGNLAGFTGVAPDAALGSELAAIIGGDSAAQVQGLRTLPNLRDVNPLPVTLLAPAGGSAGDEGGPTSFDMIAFRIPGLLMLEFEPVVDAAADLTAVQRSMRRVIGQPPDSDDVIALCVTAVEELRRLTGYDRVLAYRFESDAHGEVVAEARRPDQEPLLGLRYPAGDIPRQARLLYLTNRLRVIADVDYEPVPLRGVPGAPGAEQLDLGQSQLRSVSPVHLQYLRNMGVTATMTVSVVVDDHLWGMLACHHDAPKRPSYYLRLASETLGSMLAVQVRAYESRAERERLSDLRRLSAQVVTAMAASEHLARGAAGVPGALLGMVGADGAVAQIDGRRVTAGRVPAAAVVEGALAGLTRRVGSSPIVTDSLSAFLAAEPGAGQPGSAIVESDVDAAGALYLPLDYRSGDFVLWLRADLAKTVRWAGAPDAKAGDDLTAMNLAPRRSFAEWQQVVRGHSRPWLRAEVTSATEFAEAMPELLLHRAQNRLVQLALHDSLTGLPNRPLLLERLQGLADASSATTVNALLFVDLDRFKTVNDTLGHEAGDTLLVDAARRLRSAVRPADTVGRLGGDEFVVLLADLKDIDEAFVVAQRILRAFQASFPLTAQVHQVVTVSIGLAGAVGPFDAAELLRHSDNALYSAKRGGRNRIAVFDTSRSAQDSAAQRLTRDLEAAIGEHQLVVHYQPIISAADPWTGKSPPSDWRGVEALVRWEHPTRGLLDADHFVPLAADPDLIGALGEHVLAEVLRQLATWQWPGFYAAINVSAGEVSRPGFARHILSELAAAGLPVQSLRLEVTESQVIDQLEDAAATLAELDAAGVQIVIDDFATGFASLAYVRNFPASSLKIDRSFVSGLPDNPRDLAVVTAAIQLAHSLGMTTIAEGVETPDQLASLQLLHCDQAQGFLIGRPVPAAEIDRLRQAGRP